MTKYKKKSIHVSWIGNKPLLSKIKNTLEENTTKIEYATKNLASIEIKSK